MPTKTDTQPTPFPRLVRRAALMKLGLTPGTIHGLVTRGELTPLRIGKGMYFDREQVQRLIASARRQREPATEGPPMVA